MDPEIQKLLIDRCDQILILNGVDDGTPYRVSYIRQILLRDGIPYNILERTRHVKYGYFLFHTESKTLADVLRVAFVHGKMAARCASIERLERLYADTSTRFCVNTDTGLIDVYNEEYGVVLFDRNTNQ